MLPIVCAIALSQSPPMSILFLGNSHTTSNDFTGMVKSLLESDGSGRRVSLLVRSAGFLEDFSRSPEVRREVASRKWKYIVLQGAKQSSSHKYVYSQAGCIEIAKVAVQSGSRTLLFAEWPRRGWDETNYILGIYGEIAKASGATIAPLCRCWDVALKKQPKLDLWLGDGNHASPSGSYLAACGLYFQIAGGAGKPTWGPNFLSPAEAASFRAYARAAIIRG
jgi:hypothetical protein